MRNTTTTGRRTGRGLAQGPTQSLVEGRTRSKPPSTSKRYRVTDSRKCGTPDQAFSVHQRVQLPASWIVLALAGTICFVRFVSAQTVGDGEPLARARAGYTLGEMLADPPVRCVVCFETVDSPLAGGPALTRYTNKGAIVYFQSHARQRAYVRWQTNSLFFQREMEEVRLENLKGKITTLTPRFACGYYSNTFWNLEPSEQLTFWTMGTTNGSWVRDAVLANERLTQQAVHFGINGMRPRTMRWQGSRFEAITQDGREIRGWLGDEEDGFPATLEYEVNVATAQQPERFRIEYSYDSVFKGGRLPRRFVRYRAVESPANAWAAEREFTLASYEALYTLDSEQAFLPASLVRTNTLQLFITDQGVTYLRGKALLPVGNDFAGPRLATSSSRRSLVLVLFGSSTAVAAYLIWGVARSRGAQRQSNNKI